MMVKKSEKRLLDGEIKPEGHEKSHRSKIATKIMKPQKLWKTVKLRDYNIDRMLQDAIDE